MSDGSPARSAAIGAALTSASWCALGINTNIDGVDSASRTIRQAVDEEVKHKIYAIGSKASKTRIWGCRKSGEERSTACTRTAATLQREVPEGRKTTILEMGKDGYKRAKYVFGMSQREAGRRSTPNSNRRSLKPMNECIFPGSAPRRIQEVSRHRQDRQGFVSIGANHWVALNWPLPTGLYSDPSVLRISPLPMLPNGAALGPPIS
ncbi:hypothetical protein K438DRAFT_1778275 [Mycena galopus ATCC 62051]|nr:hypothetical protein K438DRAFT_1778275 [Mycena galopus ATCC 62051]